MRIKINHCNLFFEVYGSKLDVKSENVQEKPTLIFLHGGPGIIDHTLYVSFWSRFADIAQVILLDQRGNGRSDLGPQDSWNLSQWGDDVYEFCRVLDIKKPIVGGVSWGGHVLCSYATRHPEHPGGLIFCDTEARFNIARTLAGFERRGGQKVREIAAAYFEYPTDDKIAAYRKKCVPYYSHNPYAAKEMERAITHHEVCGYYCREELHQFNYVKELKKTHCPSLILAGEDAPLHAPESLEEIANAIPAEYSNYHLIYGAGSPVYRDSAEEVEGIIRSFIKNLS